MHGGQIRNRRLYCQRSRPVPKGQTVDGSGWVISFTLSFGLDNGTQIKFYKEDEYLNEIDRLNELFNVIL